MTASESRSDSVARSPAGSPAEAAADPPGARPALAAGFFKAHGLGNDYLVFPVGDAWMARASAVERVCDRWLGAGADGIIAYLGIDDSGIHHLRGFNPDGGEFERSGNGLRVFAAFLASRGDVEEGEEFHVGLGGDTVTMELLFRAEGPRLEVRADMGRARVGFDAVHADTEHLAPEGGIRHPTRGVLEVTPVSVGNPHGVYFTERPGVEVLRDVGPFLGSHRAFPHGLNVQVARVVGRDRLRVLVWERGAGETSASGTSACAAAVAAVTTGRMEPGSIEVEMEGGTLGVTVSPGLDVVLRGPVEEIYEGRLTDGFCEELRTSSSGPHPAQQHQPRQKKE